METIAIKMTCNKCGGPAEHIVDKSVEGHINLEYRCKKHKEQDEQKTMSKTIDEKIKEIDPIVYDDGGKTVDRYTVVFAGAVFGMSSDPFSPQGFNQYCGDITEFPQGLEHTGRRLSIDEIPEQIKKAISSRVIMMEGE